MDEIENLVSEDSGSAPALEPIAMVALDAGRMLMEAGASANSVDEIVAKFARGLGADRVDLPVHQRHFSAISSNFSGLWTKVITHSSRI